MTAVAQQVQALHSRLCELAALRGSRPPELAPPATDEALARLEAHLGGIPSDLRDLLRAADGWTNVALGGGGDPPLTFFSAAELTSEAYAAEVAQIRGRRGWKRNKLLQEGLVIALGGNHAVVLDPGPAPRASLLSFKPMGTGFVGPLAAWLEVYARGIASEIEEARTRAAPADPRALADEAVDAFNYPEEMGEHVHDSVETLRGILDRFPARSPLRADLVRLHAELVRGYAEEMRFTAARRRDDVIEVKIGEEWRPLASVAAGG